MSHTTFRICWVLACIFLCMTGAYFAKRSNDIGGYLWTLLIFINGLFLTAIWSIISRKSDALIFDNFLYDIVLCAVFSMSFVYLGCGSSFSIMNWIGTGVVLIGFILMRI